ncbi:MAG: Clp protease ClpP, partial [Burkholderiaceae bacterium]|nr:Clp protease ClpP [Burkholderiaceae bacterium]
MLNRNKPYKQFEQTFQYQHIHYYISDEIGEPAEYAEMIHRILMADPNDSIFIHLNTTGGRLDTGVQLINAIQNSEAKITTVLDGMAYSLG